MWVSQDHSVFLENEFSSGYGATLASINSAGNGSVKVQNYIFPSPASIDNSSSSYEILVFLQMVPGPLRVLK